MHLVDHSDGSTGTLQLQGGSGYAGTMKCVVALMVAGCGAAAPAHRGWPVPDGWKREQIPFPLEFAPTLDHRGIEELRFPPGFLKPDSPNRWSYTFEWQLTDEAALDATALGTEIATYFRGLLGSVDGDRHRFDPAEITARAAPQGDSFAIDAHVFDAFGDGSVVDLVGTARRHACPDHRVVWRFVLAPQASPIRATLDELAAKSPCG